jgi:hypothetical protein
MSFTIEELEALMLGRASAATRVAWVRSTPASLMHAPMPVNPMYSHGANAAAVEAIRQTLPQRAPEPADGVCGVCGEQALLLPSTLVAGSPCRHVFCKPCHSQWIATQVEERQMVIGCAAVDCEHRMSQMDIVRLSLDEVVPKARIEKLSESHLERYFEMLADPELKAWVDKNASTCPNCNVLFTRATNCNAVACPCGFRFCYCCSSWRCIRNSSQTSENAFHGLLRTVALPPQLLEVMNAEITNYTSPTF